MKKPRYYRVTTHDWLPGIPRSISGVSEKSLREIRKTGERVTVRPMPDRSKKRGK